MSNEEVVQEETVVAETVVEVNPYDEQAETQGWVPKEEWVASGKSADDWRSSKEFVERGELYKSNAQTRRELKQTQAQLEVLGRHHKYVFEKAYQTAKQDLVREKRQAMKAGDLDAVVEI